MGEPTDPYLSAAVPWPDDDELHSSKPWYSKPGAIALVAVSLVALMASIAAIVFAVNLVQVTRTANQSTAPRIPIAPTGSASASRPQTPPQDTAKDKERQRAEQAARLDPSTYSPLAPRDFALMVKDPDAWKGHKVILYGVVTQFDAATGPASFRAGTAATPQADPYDYEQNTYITARDPAILANVVEKDRVTMYVEVAGSDTYSTQIGGSTTVPSMVVNIINATGSEIGSAPTAVPMPTATVTVPVPAPVPADSESASLTQLRAFANADRPFVVSQLADRWVPQVSSKRFGMVAEGRTWNNAAILSEHQQLRQQYPAARLLWSGDWSSFSAGDFWVTVAGVSFPDSAGALAWCRSYRPDPDHCYAKLVSTTHPVEGSTAYNK
jgi:hypothetical protein